MMHTALADLAKLQRNASLRQCVLETMRSKANVSQGQCVPRPMCPKDTLQFLTSREGLSELLLSHMKQDIFLDGKSCKISNNSI